MKPRARRDTHAPSRSGPIAKRCNAAMSCIAAARSRSTRRPASSSAGDAGAQAERVIENLGAVLCAAGYHYVDVVKTTIFLVDINDFAAVNSVYEKYFGLAKPARSTVAVAALPRGARVEIDCIARSNVPDFYCEIGIRGICRSSRAVSSFAICETSGSRDEAAALSCASASAFCPCAA